MDGPIASARFGVAMAIAGDVNGDGYADLVVGAPRPTTDAGRAHVFLGGAGGLGATAGLTIVGPDGAAWVTEGGQNSIARVDPKDHRVQLWKLTGGPSYANLNTLVFPCSMHVTQS